MTEFKVYHFNWTATPIKKDLLQKMNSFSDDSFDSVLAKNETSAVKAYIKDHGLPSNDAALIGIKTKIGSSLFIAKTNKNRTCAVEAVTQ